MPKGLPEGKRTPLIYRILERSGTKPSLRVPKPFRECSKPAQCSKKRLQSCITEVHFFRGIQGKIAVLVWPLTWRPQGRCWLDAWKAPAWIIKLKLALSVGLFAFKGWSGTNNWVEMNLAGWVRPFYYSFANLILLCLVWCVDTTYDLYVWVVGNGSIWNPWVKARLN